MKTEAEPQLAPPGAGLPRLELFVARRLFASRLKRGNREDFNAHFRKERATIAELVAGCDAESAARRVLIDRPRGLEDSSRYWSVWMTLEHLRIVNGAVTRLIGALAQGVKMDGAASTAAVKPSPHVTGDVVSAYGKSCDDLLTTVAGIANLDTSERYTHPWFGSLNAAGWHAMAAGHMEIHRVQMERIVGGLQQRKPQAELVA